MNHTLFFQEGIWHAKGQYHDEEDRPVAAEGETKITHLQGKWLNEGKLKLLGDNPAEFQNAYEIVPFKDGEDTTEWNSINSPLGTIRGKLMVIDDSIISVFRSEDGLYSGSEYMLQTDARNYKARGFLFRGDRKISSWSVELHKAE